MADKAMTDPASMLGAFLNTAKAEKATPSVAASSAVKGAFMPSAGIQARISAVDDNKAPAPVPAFNPAAELLRRLYGL
jgi:hypothetical protein